MPKHNAASNNHHRSNDHHSHARNPLARHDNGMMRGLTISMEEMGDNFLSPFLTMQRQMNNFMEDAWRNFSHAPMWPADMDRMMPKVKVWEDGESFHLQTKLPMNKPENIEVSVNDNYMTIRWSDEMHEMRGENGEITRTSSHMQHRTIMLPQNADPEGAEALVKDRTLEIIMPKRKDAESEGRTIPVKKLG